LSSASLEHWQTQGAAALDEIAAAHAAVGGTAPGRRWATQQINYAYTMLLSSQFQRFCRDLHPECTDHLVSSVNPAILRTVLRAEFTAFRQLDRGNAGPANIGSDFNRFGLAFWSAVRGDHGQNRAQQAMLENLQAWRNAIAHQDFDHSKLHRANLTLPTVRRWRRACNALARSFDRVLGSHLTGILAAPPW
jgi:hypothetical protein